MARAKPPSFTNIYRHGFVRAAVCAPIMAPADPAANCDAVLALAREADANNAALVLFPELCLSGYAIDDLLLQATLLDSVEASLGRILEQSRALAPVLILGAPLRLGHSLYNCAVIVQRGQILGVVPKSYLPNYREFYEKRHFAPGDAAIETSIHLAGQTAPFGARLLFACENFPDFTFHVEICEDLWAPIPPSCLGSLAGAHILCNLSASNITIGKSQERELLCDAQSRRCLGAYLYAASGFGESTNDVAWDGQTFVFENGEKLAQGARFLTRSSLIFGDIDVQRLALERLRVGTFRDAATRHGPALREFRRIAFAFAPDLTKELPLSRAVPRFPFVPNDRARLDQDCFEAYHIQVHALMTRLKAARISKAVIGISGGLDSTQALLVTARAFDLMGLPRKHIIALTMPGFATSARTKSQALALMHGLNVDARELDIRPAARQMLADIGHPFAAGEALYDITFENVQAGLRTDYLFRIANHEGGMVIGTGDLSELALGWCTYGVGDQMSHYNVNAGLAKTLIQHLIAWCAANGQYDEPTSAALAAILHTEISPELVPSEAGAKPQSTQDRVGPYPLVDFALHYVSRHGLAPSKILFLATHAWAHADQGDWPANIALGDRRAYSQAEIAKWLRVFLQRFFGTSQFKRSAMPNGPKISSAGALSPRGDWRAPSDGSPRAWLEELDAAFPPPP